ncbi:hypothetical protein EDD86DRAFT_198269 [Gorgonomyces haynaldii]|nr:hypothetical protein EDD86DRAFT_198269 [Gorgonomyces haynaldii]
MRCDVGASKAVVVQKAFMLYNLPVEISLHIASYLSIQDYCRLNRTCKRFYLLEYPKHGTFEMGAFIRCLKRGSLKLTLELMQSTSYDPTWHTQYPIWVAVRSKFPKVVELMLQDPRVEPDCYDNNLVRYCASEGKDKMLALLLTHKSVDPGSHDNEALRLAIKYGHKSTVQLLSLDSRVLLQATCKRHKNPSHAP